MDKGLEEHKVAQQKQRQKRKKHTEKETHFRYMTSTARKSTHFWNVKGEEAARKAKWGFPWLLWVRVEMNSRYRKPSGFQKEPQRITYRLLWRLVLSNQANSFWKWLTGFKYMPSASSYETMPSDSTVDSIAGPFVLRAYFCSGFFFIAQFKVLLSFLNGLGLLLFIAISFVLLLLAVSLMSVSSFFFNLDLGWCKSSALLYLLMIHRSKTGRQCLWSIPHCIAVEYNGCICSQYQLQ